jgi:hypothetical protein
MHRAILSPNAEKTLRRSSNLENVLMSQGSLIKIKGAMFQKHPW